MKIGFAIIPQQELVDRLIFFQKSSPLFENFQPKLSTSKNLPHITIFQGDFNSVESLTPGINYLKGKVSFLSKQTLIFDSVEYVDQGWYFIKTNVPNWLSELQFDLLTIIENAIVLPKENQNKDISKYSQKERQNFKKYGYRYIGDAYSPHVTFGRTPTKSRHIYHDLVLKSISDEFKGNTFQSSKITLYKMGDNGSHEETLLQIDLNN